MKNSTKTNGSRLALKFLTLSCLILFSFSSTNAITVWWVATTGNNANPGTSALPFKTLQRGVDAAAAGDTIIVMDGVYGPEGADSNSFAVNINKAGTSSAWITIRAQNKWGAVLDCQLTAHSYINFQANSAYWKIQGFEIKNGWDAGIWSNSRGGKNIIISENHIHHIGNRIKNDPDGIAGIYTDAGAQNFTVDRNVINDVGRTNTHNNSFDHGIYSHGNLNITNNVFYRSLNGWHIQTAIDFSGTIANNTFYGPNMFTGYSKGGQLTLWDIAGGSIIIRNNIFYNTKVSAIHLSSFSQGSGTCSIDHNIIYGAGITVVDDSFPFSVSNNYLNTDPLFVDTVTYNFHLKPMSPARDSGVTVSLASKDFDGVSRPQCSAYDIGAFEYNCGTPPPASPAVSITSPSNGATYTALASVTIKASASDADGVVSKVEFYNGSTLLNTDFSSPYSYSWINTPAGNYSLTAKAYDNDGAITTSTAVSVTVNCGGPDNFANTSFTTQTGLFTSEFDVTPAGANLNGIIGLSNGFACDSVGLACIIRFNSTGQIDARNGGVYQAASTITYSAGTSYHVKMLVNISKKKYDIYVTPQGGNAIILGLQYNFRTEQNGLLQLDNWSQKIWCKKNKENKTKTKSCNLNVTNFTNAAIICGPTDNFPNNSFTNQTGTFTTNFDVVATRDSVDGVVGLSNGAATTWSNLACIIGFMANGTIQARNGGVYSAASTIPYSKGRKYHVKMYVDLGTHKYDIYVTPEGSSTITVGTNYNFRGEQSTITQLNNWSKATASCMMTVTNFAVVSGIVSGVARTPLIMEVSLLRTGEYVKIYPNPSDDYLTIDANLNNTPKVRMSIFDIHGRMIWTHSYGNSMGYFNKRVSVKNFAPGIYILKFLEKGRVVSEKFIVK